MTKILFYVERELQLPFLEPVHDELAKNNDYETYFAAPAYQPSSETIPGWGLRPAQIQRLSRKSTFIPEGFTINADLAVVADNCHEQLAHIDKIVNIGHGLICKGFYYTDSPKVRRENLSSLVCVPGPWHKNRLASQVFSPIQVTGFIKSDLLFGPKAGSKEDFCAQKSISPANKIILFAPTFTPELTCLDLIGEQISKVADSQTALLVKLHNMTDPAWEEYFTQQAKKNKNIIILQDEDYSEMMQAADLMISDISSMYIEFMLLDKPVILVNNPKASQYIGYDPADIEYLAQEAVHTIDDSSELLSKVEYVLEHPAEKSALRKKYIHELDYGRDGQSAARTAQAIKDVLENKPGLKITRPQVTLFIDATGTDEEEIKDFVAELEESKLGTKTILLLSAELELNTEAKQIETIVIDNKLQNYDYILQRYSQDYIAILKCGFILPKNWLWHLWLHLKWNTEMEAVRAMADPILMDQYFVRMYPELDIEEFGIQQINHKLLTASIGQSIQNSDTTSAAFIIKNKTLKDILSESKPAHKDSKNFIFEDLNSLLPAEKIILAVDVYLHPRDAQIISIQKAMQKAENLIAKGQYQKAQEILSLLNL